MTKDELVNEAVRAYVQAGKRGLDLVEAITCVVELATEVEREACAKVCEEGHHNGRWDDSP